MPVTMPVDPTTTLLLLALQVPPPEMSVSVLVRPWHTGFEPLMAAGNGFIVTTVEMTQPVGRV